MDLVRTWAISRKEILQLRRDPRSLAMGFLLPVLLLVLFGYAITWDVREIKSVIVDQDASRSSRDLAAALRSSGYFEVRAPVGETNEAVALLDRGTVQLVLVIPPGFAADLGAGRTAPLQALVDGSDANTATIILGYVQAIVQNFAGGRPTEVRSVPFISAASRVWYNEEMLSRNMIVPGLIAVIMMIIAAMLTSLTIAREWERGTMEQLASTPVSRLEVVLGKMLPYLAIGLLDVVITSLVGVTLFGVPFRGSAAMLMGASFFFIIGALGLGIFISAATRSQLLATQIAMVATFLPAFLLSGFMFAIEVMPQTLQLLTRLIPARYFIVVTRGLFLKGVGPSALWAQGLSMIAFAVIGIALAVRVFRKELS
ncbi:MAG: ABC transporter permease [Candidatus Eisenbacteria bacterium]|uniref:ABC transporter permease n=1 Tax=Eiseniibacteriota bacterium TaxID=2212470 RepID=A0A948W8I6_UNCEI|nr:ABC transporter permease [Candidatus Eisenbacteria bacterium]MBU1947181.1 ABC transporter permease [Candidatus Eisenbacteria bacterium]MBU2693370.1 ABC transporter permease [Candidatus Eisenbacteria bacterium]